MKITLGCKNIVLFTILKVGEGVKPAGMFKMALKFSNLNLFEINYWIWNEKVEILWINPCPPSKQITYVGHNRIPEHWYCMQNYNMGISPLCGKFVLSFFLTKPKKNCWDYNQWFIIHWHLPNQISFHNFIYILQ